ncbi:MAG TPA: alpha-L-fucosidase [bacterium]|nr:alpha-L-fucosidase [bacterium]HOL65831.1 alpha-L-fucosidase [bacterium]HPP12267.1 alpha-L-fucosidase [bacterium]
MVRLAWHFDLHTPGYVPVNTCADFKGMARALKAAGVEEIICFAKCHFGYAYYPTRVGTVHPRLKGDLFGGVVTACRKTGLKVLAYVSFGLDGQAGRKHIEWQRHWEGTPVIAEDSNVFLQVCPFSPYTEELMLPQIEELINFYRPDGFFFDTMSALAACRCLWCRQAFQKEFGQEIPEKENSALFPLFGRWRHDRGIALLQRISEFIQARLPGSLVGFNQIGSLPYPEPMPPAVTVLTLDPPTPGPQSLQLATNAAYAVTADRPADIMPTIFNQGWGDWSLAPLTRMEQAAATVWSHGARLYLGDRLRPEGCLDRQTLVALKFIKKVKRQFSQAAPENGSEPKPDVLILHTPEVAYGDDYRYFATVQGRERVWSLIGGSHRLLLEAGVNTAVVAESFLKDHLDKAGLVILPELTSLKETTASLLQEFVENGGCLLSAGCLPRIDGQTTEWAGLLVEEELWQDHLYLPAWPEDQQGLPVLVRGKCNRLKLAGAETVLPAIPAFEARAGQRYGWGIGPACLQPSPYPVLTRYLAGRGEIWHLAVPIFSDYYRHGNWQQLLWMKGLLQRLPVTFRVRAEAIGGNIEVLLREKENTWWVFLVNHAGEEIFGVTAPVWARTVGPVPPRKVSLKLFRDGRRPVRVSQGKRTLPFSFAGGTASLSLQVKRVWEVLRIDW